jgi:hypothetical protein
MITLIKVFRSISLECEVFVVIEPMTDRNSPKFYKGHVLIDCKNKYIHVYDENGINQFSEYSEKINFNENSEIVLKTYRKYEKTVGESK